MELFLCKNNLCSRLRLRKRTHIFSLAGSYRFYTHKNNTRSIEKREKRQVDRAIEVSDRDKMARVSRQGIILDALKHKIRIAKHELDRYKDDYLHCQQTLAHELQLREQVEKENAKLQRSNSQLVCELQGAVREVASQQATLVEARAALIESDRLRRALEQRDQLQTEKIDLLIRELTKLRRQAREADRTAKYCDKRANELCEYLSSSEQQLEESRASAALLQSELTAAARNLHCVERAFERSSKQLHTFDRQVAKLKQRLHESEKRAHQAELSVQELQYTSAHLEQRLEQRYDLSPQVTLTDLLD